MPLLHSNINNLNSKLTHEVEQIYKDQRETREFVAQTIKRELHDFRHANHARMNDLENDVLNIKRNNDKNTCKKFLLFFCKKLVLFPITKLHIELEKNVAIVESSNLGQIYFMMSTWMAKKISAIRPPIRPLCRNFCRSHYFIKITKNSIKGSVGAVKLHQLQNIFL